MEAIVLMMEHIKYFKSHESILTNDGKEVQVWDFNVPTDLEIPAEWAKHFRNHYCLDEQIDILRDGTGLSRKDYLMKLKFPSASDAPGPSIRVGDFGEILVADFLQYISEYWVPRIRYLDKDIRNESSKGSDVIGFKFFDQSLKTLSPQDVLTIFEVKAQFSGKKANPRLQDAVNDSNKDHLRIAESLNAIKQRYLHQSKNLEATRIARFQNIVDNPYEIRFGAAALYEESLYDKKIVSETDTNRHSYRAKLTLLIIRGVGMMDLVHKLYESAADV